MKFIKIDKQEVCFVKVIIGGAIVKYMRVSPNTWYVEQITGEYNLIKLPTNLEDAFQEQEKDPATEEKEEWYAVPPYRNEGWQALNERGELVATFETKEECIRAVNAVNKK